MADPMVRDAVETDRAAIETVAAESLAALDRSPSVGRWGADMRRHFVARWLPPPAEAGRGTTMLAAEVAGTVVAAASASRGRRHPHAFLRIGVRPGSRRQGAGTALLAALSGRGLGPFWVREMRSDVASIAFFRSHGFVTGETTTEGLIDPLLASTRQWIADGLTATNGVGVDVVPAGQAHLTEVEVARLLDSTYRWTHPWSPPTPLADEEAVALYLGSARSETASVAVHGEEPVGAGVLVESPFHPSPDLAYLVSLGVKDGDLPHAGTITTSLVAHCFEAARRRGWRVETEVNDTHPYLWDAVLSIPGARLFSDLTILVSRYGG